MGKIPLRVSGTIDPLKADRDETLRACARHLKFLKDFDKNMKVIRAKAKKNKITIGRSRKYGEVYFVLIPPSGCDPETWFGDMECKAGNNDAISYFLLQRQ